MSRKVTKFLRNTCGATALIFGMAAIPTVGAMGIALDYMRAGMAHSRLQSAVDSAALAAGASDSTNTSQICTSSINTFRSTVTGSADLP